MLIDMMPFTFSLAIVLGSFGASGAAAPAKGDKSIVIAVEKHETWKEGDGGSAHHVMRCGEFSVSLSLSTSREGITLQNLQLDGQSINEVLRAEFELGLNNLGGFDYPYILCTSSKVLLAFDYRPPEGETKSFGKELN